MKHLPPPSGDMEKLVLALEHLGETLQNASMPYGASLVMKAISCIRALGDRNVYLETNNKMLLTRQAALEDDLRERKEREKKVRELLDRLDNGSCKPSCNCCGGVRTLIKPILSLLSQ